jgi:hypothetical protein
MPHPRSLFAALPTRRRDFLEAAILGKAVPSGASEILHRMALLGEAPDGTEVCADAP